MSWFVSPSATQRITSPSRGGECRERVRVELSGRCCVASPYLGTAVHCREARPEQPQDQPSALAEVAAPVGDDFRGPVTCGIEVDVDLVGEAVLPKIDVEVAARSFSEGEGVGEQNWP